METTGKVVNGAYILAIQVYIARRGHHATFPRVCWSCMCASYFGGPAKKTETVSYRVRADLKSALEEEARRLGINPNALVSQIFSRHVSWGRYVGQLKFIPVSKDFLRFMFESMPRDQIEKIGRSLGESVAHEELLFLFSRITPGTILMFMDLWASHFDAWDHRYEGGKHFFTVKHDVNLNFSYFTREYVSAVLLSTLGANVQFEKMSPNSVTFVFESALDKGLNNRLPSNTGNNRASNSLAGNSWNANRLNTRPEEAVVKD